MINKYENLFPFHKVPFKSNIIIYGAGDLGQDYLKQIKLLDYCHIVGMVDQNYKEYKFLCVPVYSIDMVTSLDFDYVVIALKSKFISTIINRLLDFGMREEQIIYTGVYNSMPDITFDYLMESEKTISNELIRIAIKLYRCGYGDVIISKSFVDRILDLCPKATIDLYSTVRIAKYIPCVYGENKRIKIISPQNSMFDYEESKNNYMLSMQWNILLRIDVFRKNDIKKIDTKFAYLIENLATQINRYNKLSHFDVMMLAKYKGRNVYTKLYYQDVLGIDNMHVNIVLDEKDNPLEDTISLPHVYITIDLSDERGSDKLIKLWPRSYMELFIKMFKLKYPGIEVIQLGDEDAENLSNTCTFKGLDFEKVKYILRKAILHIGPEGGSVHLASQLGTKCVVLFGGTPIWYYGYPQNINISARVCDPCFCLLDGSFGKCVKGSEKPKCMYSITPQIVMDKVEEYFNSVGVV